MQMPTSGKNISAQPIPFDPQFTLGVGIPEKVEKAITSPCSTDMNPRSSKYG